MTLRVVLIGYGLGGAAFHAPLISSVPGMMLVAVVTGNPERQEAVRQRYPGVAVLPEPAAVFAEPQHCDLVVVSTPNRTHVTLATGALKAGLPVVVDKPVAVTSAQARELESYGPPVFPYHNRRWDGDFRTARRLIGEGALGEVRRFESRFERWRPEVAESWKESRDPADAGSILYDLGTHLVDQSICLFGPPTHVYAEVDTRRAGAQVPDDVFLGLTHEGGVRSHLWMSATAADLGPRFRVLGSEASYVIHGMDGQEAALRAGRTPREPGWGQMPPETYGLLGVPGRARPVRTDAGAYQDFYKGVAATLQNGAPPPVPMADAIAGLEVIEAALRSAVGR
ncbi:Gfo/Idh/MocA family oxidoreductase [Actinocorallia sp. A-T 12471]|uniref:Gfo/Idh/MocA family protein n=1 Tax=Actinocorallia sp. A-T 12471 TaxID=3089813 RepID=UPI0029CE41B8|nr:Gfo/Idh/MocA family oxidoreductase [Actinocorallia sp. A-T 12471]MDX6741236.1 Gfo/Idh/MocA family oxidoreductase [Actinocorallia sp. A-T 12471]